MAASYVPARGDIVRLQSGPRSGHKQSGGRAVLIISPRPYNQKVGLALFCPITGQIKGYPFEVALPPHVGLSGVILSDQVKSLDWRARKAKRIVRVPPDTVEEVLNKLSTLVA